MSESIITKRSYNFSLDIIKLIDQLPNKKVSWIISDQLLRSATSIGANIVEAKSSSSRKEYINYFQIALKSANETRYWLNLLLDSGLIDKDKFDKIYTENEEICKMLASSVITLKNK